MMNFEFWHRADTDLITRPGYPNVSLLREAVISHEEIGTADIKNQQVFIIK